MDINKIIKRIIFLANKEYYLFIRKKVTKVVPNKKTYSVYFGEKGYLDVIYNQTQDRIFLEKIDTITSKVARRKLKNKKETEKKEKREFAKANLSNHSSYKQTVNYMQAYMNRKVMNYPAIKKIQVSHANGVITFTMELEPNLFMIKEQTLTWQKNWSFFKNKGKDLDAIIVPVLDSSLKKLSLSDKMTVRIQNELKELQQKIKNRLVETVGGDDLSIYSAKDALYLSDILRSPNKGYCSLTDYPKWIDIYTGPFEMRYVPSDNLFIIQNEAVIWNQINQILFEQDEYRERYKELLYYQKACDILKNAGLNVYRCNGLPRHQNEKQDKILFYICGKKENGLKESTSFSIIRKKDSSLPDLKIIKKNTGTIWGKIDAKIDRNLLEYKDKYSCLDIKEQFLVLNILRFLKSYSRTPYKRTVFECLKGEQLIAGTEYITLPFLTRDLFNNVCIQMEDAGLITIRKKKLKLAHQYVYHAYSQALFPRDITAIQNDIKNKEDLSDVDLLSYISSLDESEFSMDDWLSWLNIILHPYLYHMKEDIFLQLFQKMPDVMLEYVKVMAEMCEDRATMEIYKKIISSAERWRMLTEKA